MQDIKIIFKFHSHLSIFTNSPWSCHIFKFFMHTCIKLYMMQKLFLKGSVTVFLWITYPNFMAIEFLQHINKHSFVLSPGYFKWDHCEIKPFSTKKELSKSEHLFKNYTWTYVIYIYRERDELSNHLFLSRLITILWF